MQEKGSGVVRKGIFTMIGYFVVELDEVFETNCIGIYSFQQLLDIYFFAEGFVGVGLFYFVVDGDLNYLMPEI